jgi:hypothetical protein
VGTQRENRLVDRIAKVGRMFSPSPFLVTECIDNDSCGSSNMKEYRRTRHRWTRIWQPEPNGRGWRLPRLSLYRLPLLCKPRASNHAAHSTQYIAHRARHHVAGRGSLARRYAGGAPAESLVLEHHLGCVRALFHLSWCRTVSWVVGVLIVLFGGGDMLDNRRTLESWRA